MWIDLNTIETSPFAGEYDACICGSGPAGMAVAQKLIAKGARVLLLEAGGMEPTVESQAVYQGESVGPLTYYGVEACRLRYFGGTSNHWTGRCGVFDPLDFEQRDIWELPGWPIAYEDAYEYLDEALIFLDLKPGDVDRRQEPDWVRGRMVPSGFAWSKPTRVGEKFASSLKAADNVDVALNANVTGLNFAPGGDRIESITVENYGGGKFTVAAQNFVIAFGALENARFLLNAGLGERLDMVGRCFMEHFGVTLGRFIPTSETLSKRTENVSLNPSPDIARNKKLGNAVVTLTPGGAPKFYGRLAPLRRMRRNITCGNDMLLQMARAKNDILCDGDGMVTTIMEQTPNMMSRVTLDGAKTDQFGKARLQLDWRITEQDQRTVYGMAKEIGKAMAENGLARLRIADDLRDGGAELGFHCHQMGTTRMSSDPRHGVVDENSTVHGIENLHIGGSSVFSTGGGVNPTLTIVALALRLGDHLGSKLALN